MLKKCCLASKSWTPRTRKHLFAYVQFHTSWCLGPWKTTFPDRSTSPARYTKTLHVICSWEITAADAKKNDWIQTFSRVVCLRLDLSGLLENNFAEYLALFHGLSPAIKFLRLDFSPLPFPRIFNLTHPFPLLENLSVPSPNRHTDTNDVLYKQHIAARSPPAFTGRLTLRGVDAIATWLLSLPSGIHFRVLCLKWDHGDDVSSTTALVDSCSSTLKALYVDFGLIGTSL